MAPGQCHSHWELLVYSCSSPLVPAWGPVEASVVFASRLGLAPCCTCVGAPSCSGTVLEALSRCLADNFEGCWNLLRWVSNSPDSSAPFLEIHFIHSTLFLCIKGSESLGSFHSFSAPFWLQNWLLLFLQVIYWLIGCFSFCCHLNFMATSWHLSFAQYPCHHFWSWSSSLLQFSFTLTPLNFIKVSFMTCHHSIGVFLSFQFISIVVLCFAFKIAVNSGITSLILFCF